MRLLARDQRGNAIPRRRAQHDSVWPLRALPCGSESCNYGFNIIAVHLARLPSERTPLLANGLHVEHHRAVCLDPVAVDERHEVIEPEMTGGHRRLPGGAFLHLSIRKLAENAHRGIAHAFTQCHADRLTESVP